MPQVFISEPVHYNTSVVRRALHCGFHDFYRQCPLKTHPAWPKGASQNSAYYLLFTTISVFSVT